MSNLNLRKRIKLRWNHFCSRKRLVVDWFKSRRTHPNVAPTSTPTITSTPVSLKRGERIFWAVTVATSLALFIAVWCLWREVEIKTWFKINPGIIILAIGVAYTLFGLRTLGPDRLGSKLFFGRPLYQLKPGLVFIPPFLCDKREDTRNVIQLEISAAKAKNPPEISSGANLMFGRTEELHILFADGKQLRFKPDAQKRWENSQFYPSITIDPVLIIRYRIGNHPRFIGSIGTIEAANNQMEDAAIAELSHQAGKITLAQALANLNALSTKIRKAVEKTIGEGNDVERSWGIELENVAVKIPGISKQISEAQAQRAKADDAAKAVIIAGQGEAAVETAKVAAFGKGLKQGSDASGLPVETLLAAQTAIGMAQGANLTAVNSDGLAGLTAAGSVIAQAIRAQKITLPTTQPT